MAHCGVGVPVNLQNLATTVKETHQNEGDAITVGTRNDRVRKSVMTLN